MKSTSSSAKRWLFACAAVALLPLGATAAQRPASVLYSQAQEAEKRLHRSESLVKDRAQWLRVARMYRNVVIHHPRSGYCDDALYFAGEIYTEIDRRFGDASSVQKALDAYALLANGYPSSKWAKRARLSRGKLYLDRLSDRKNASIELRKVASGWPRSAEAAEAKRLLDLMSRPKRAQSEETFPEGIVGVRNIRYFTGKEYTRVVIDMDDKVRYREGSVQNPDRIYFDLLGTRLTRDLATRQFPVEDGFLRQVRVGQNQSDVVRVVLDFENISEYNAFTLPDPYRLVVDILGTEPKSLPETVVADSRSPASTPRAESGASAEPPAERSSASAAAEPDVVITETDVRLPASRTRDGNLSTARQLGLSVGRIVIDPGHGGHDPGTMIKTGVREKDLVLDISRRVSKILAEDFEVIMTRDADVFIPLEERTAIANANGADLFVSIHINAARSTRPRGTETYFLNLATTPDAEEVAARENAVTTRRLGELQSLLQKIVNNTRITESREFASHVQDAMAVDLYSTKKDPRNRGVKQAPFYVLLGAQMPSVLVEVAYLTNRQDAKLLEDVTFRQKVAESIAKGIRSYHGTLLRTTKASIPVDRVAGNK